MGALRATSVTNINEAFAVGADSTYGSVLFEQAGYCQALADDIDFKLPE